MKGIIVKTLKLLNRNETTRIGIYNDFTSCFAEIILPSGISVYDRVYTPRGKDIKGLNLTCCDILDIDSVQRKEYTKWIRPERMCRWFRIIPIFTILFSNALYKLLIYNFNSSQQKSNVQGWIFNFGNRGLNSQYWPLSGPIEGAQRPNHTPGEFGVAVSLPTGSGAEPQPLGRWSTFARRKATETPFHDFAMCS